MARGKKSQPTWKDVKTSLQTFDRIALQGVVQDLYGANEANRAFLHARLDLGPDQLKPFREIISRWINPDLMRNQMMSVSKSKKAIADYKRAIGHPEGLAELSIFYCEEAFGFLESCGMDDESYFLALIRMYDQAMDFVLNLPKEQRRAYAERLDKLRSRAGSIGWGVEDALNEIWYEADLDTHDSQ